MDKTLCSGVVLAGGMNIRFGGQQKALVKIGSQTILERILSQFRHFFNDSFLITNQPARYLTYDIPIVTDLYSIRSPLCGIHTGLFYAKTPYIFVVACDIPFLKKEMIQTILSEIEPRYDVIVPETDKGFEALCAVYAKRCLPVIERQLKQQIALTGESASPSERVLFKGLKVRGFFNQVRVKHIPEEKLRERDPELVSFFNINRPEDLEKAFEIEPTFFA